jgi:NADH-quinone oxidoreductase subunit I
MTKFFKKLISSITEIGRGMFTIIKHVIRPAITLEYPEKRPELNSRFRGRPALLVNPDGTLKCAGCKCCARVCPCMDLIQIETEKDENNKQTVKNFTIDLGRCIFCGNCTEVCPSKGIIMTNEFELADYSRESLVFDKNKLKLSIADSLKYRDMIEKDA